MGHRQDQEWIAAQIERLRAEGLERDVRSVPFGGAILFDGAKRLLNLSSNDYLNLSHHPAVMRQAEEAIRRYGASASASRLVTGTLSVHEELEEKLQEFFSMEGALVCGSGALANMSLLSTLCGRDDTVIADKLVHATIIDGATLSRAKLLRYRHNDLEHLEEILKGVLQTRGRSAKVVVVTESVFSMDGDTAPVREIAALCRKYGAMFVVDEAHAVGVFGPAGRGILARDGLLSEVTAVTGTFSKALGSYGGFVVCSEALRRLIINRARQFIYTTALPPASAAAAAAALEVVRTSETLGEELLRRASRFREKLGELAFELSTSQIVPVMLGDNFRALSASDRLSEKGIIARAIRSPTVPPGTARLRFSISLGHSEEELASVAEQVREVIESVMAKGE